MTLKYKANSSSFQKPFHFPGDEQLLEFEKVFFSSEKQVLDQLLRDCTRTSNESPLSILVIMESFIAKVLIPL